MKIHRIILSAVLITGISLIASCDGGSEKPNSETKFLTQLSATWTLHKVTLNGKNMSNYFPGLVLSVTTDKNFSVTKPVSPIWPASGTFELVATADQDLFNVQRSDGVVITITELSETMLRYTIPHDASGGRLNDVSGNYEFEMSR